MLMSFLYHDLMCLMTRNKKKSNVLFILNWHLLWCKYCSIQANKAVVRFE